MPPRELALARAASHARRKKQPVSSEVPDGGAHSAGSRKRVEEESHALLHLLVGIFHDASEDIVDEADWQTAAQLAAPCLVEDAAAQASAEHVQLRFAHRPLEPE